MKSIQKGPGWRGVGDQLLTITVLKDVHDEVLLDSQCKVAGLKKGSQAAQ
jgi:hypothetical protein